VIYPRSHSKSFKVLALELLAAGHGLNPNLHCLFVSLNGTSKYCGWFLVHLVCNESASKEERHILKSKFQNMPQFCSVVKLSW